VAVVDVFWAASNDRKVISEREGVSQRVEKIEFNNDDEGWLPQLYMYLTLARVLSTNKPFALQGSSAGGLGLGHGSPWQGGQQKKRQP